MGILREIHALRHRLGSLRTFDVVNSHISCLADNEDSREDGNDGEEPSSTRTGGYEEKVPGLVSNLHGNIYVLDLSVHEDWQIARLLLRLTREDEKRCSLIDGMYTDRHEQHALWYPPESWFHSGPANKGIMSIRLIAQGDKRLQ